MRSLKHIAFLVAILMCSMSTSAQCLLNRHNTSVNDGWVSCQKTISPNPANGSSHWISYEFDSPTNIYKTHVWNVNQTDYLLWGAKEIKIEHSLNGSTWINDGVYTITKGTGSSRYQGSSGPDLQGINAKYLLITILETYGGSCAGFGEWKFYTQLDNTTELALDLRVCENDDVIKHINGGMNLGGTYSGNGVINNYDDSFDFDPNLAGPGQHQITYDYPGGSSSTLINVRTCSQAYCPPCPTCDELSQAEYDATPIAEGTWYDLQINSSGTVAPNTNVNFRGAEHVTMTENFQVDNGGFFHAVIRECEEENNLLANPSFDSDTQSWYITTHINATATLAHSPNVYYNGDGAALIETNSPDETDWHVQFEQNGLTIEANSTYTLTFAAKASSPFSSWLSLQLNQSPWTSYGGSTVHYNTEWQQFTIVLETTTAGPPNSVRLSMNLGNLTTNAVFFDNFLLVKNE